MQNKSFTYEVFVTNYVLGIYYLRSAKLTKHFEFKSGL